MNSLAGLALLVLAFIGISKKNPLSLSDIILGSILLTVGICLFTPWLSFAGLVEILVIALMGLGIGLIISGALCISKKVLFNGIGQVVIGVLMVTFVIIYKTVPDFAQAFWIIIGILVAIYGALVIVSALLLSEKK